MYKNIEEIRTALFCGKRIYDIPLRVTFYGRVSTDEDKQLNSLEHQIAYFESKIKSCEKWEYVPGYIDEGITGTRADKRPQFLKMVRDAKAGAFDLILTKEVSRFARDIVDCVQTVRELLRYDVGVLIEDINLNTMDKDAEFRLSIMAIVAQEESRKTSERVKFGYRQTMKEGKRHGATPPIGYRFNNENNGYHVDEQKSKLVRFVFEEYAKGELGTRRISELLVQKGFLNDAGNPYNPSTIERMIRNPVYLGYIVNGKTYKPHYREDKHIAIPRDKWQLYYDPVRVPPLVSEEVWEKANYVLRERSKRLDGVDCSGKDATGLGKYAYSNRIVCGDHGCGYHRSASRWTVDGVQKRVEYWRCCLYKKYGRKQCEAPILYKRDLDEIMRKLFSTLIPLLKDACGSLHGALAQALEEKQGEDIPELERQIVVLEQKKKKLLDGWMNNVVSDSDYQDMRKRLERQIEKLNERKSQSEKASVEPNVSAASFTIMQKAISNTNLDSEEMLDELVRCFVYKIVVKRKEDAEVSGKKVPYMLEIWLQNAQTPANFDLAQCARTHPNPGRHTVP